MGAAAVAVGLVGLVTLDTLQADFGSVAVAVAVGVRVRVRLVTQADEAHAAAPNLQTPTHPKNLQITSRWFGGPAEGPDAGQGALIPGLDSLNQ